MPFVPLTVRDPQQADPQAPTDQTSRFVPLRAQAAAEVAPVATQERPGFGAELARNALPWLAEGVNTIVGAPFDLAAPDGSAADFFRRNAEWWRTKQSDEVQSRLAASGQRIDAAGKDGVMAQIGAAAGEYVDDPILAARLGVTNIPSLIPGLGLGKAAQVAGVAGKLGAGAQAALGLGVAGGTNAVLNAGGARGESFEDLKKAAMARGIPEADAVELALQGSKLAAVIGGVAGFVGGRTGVEKALLGAASPGKALASGARAAAAELAGEQIEEVAPKLATNFAGQTLDQRSLGQDVGRTIVDTAVGSGPMAAAAGGATAYRALPAAEKPAPAPADLTGAVADDERAAPPPAAVDEAVAALNKPPVELTALDRVQQLDAQIAAAAPDADLAPLQVERAALSKDWPAMNPGTRTTFSTETGAQLEGQYALIDIDDLKASHDGDLKPNPAYPKALQPRERDRAASATQIQGIVSRLDPARLGESATAAEGAPIIGADGLVESGNARTIALGRVYAANGLKAKQYRDWLAENADRFGLTAQQIEGMRKPVLVRVRSTPVNRAEFARQANAPTVAVMSPREQALSDAARIDNLDDLRPTDEGDFSTSRDFLRRFVGGLSQTERGAVIDADGGLSATGYARARNAVLAKAYGDSPVLTRLVESMDDTGRNIAKALIVAAPRMAQARAMAAAGQRYNADLTPALVEVAGELERLRQSGQGVGEALQQQAIDGQGRSAAAGKLLRFMSDNARRPRRIADLLQAYADALDAAGDPAQGSLLGDSVAPTVDALLDGALREVNASDAAVQTQPQAQAEGGQAPATGGIAGSPAAPAAVPGATMPGVEAPGVAPANDATGPDWVGFGPESGTLGIPRAEMPQVKMVDRGAMVNFLKARGIEHEIVEVDPASLKPTQAEFSRAKVRKSMDAEGDTATALVSADGYVVDGHHRWLAQRVKGEPLRALRFNAPALQVIEAIHAFPSSRKAGDSAQDPRRAAVQDFKDALADLGEFLTKHQRAAIVQEHTPEMHAILVKLFESAVTIIGTDLKRAISWAKQQLKANPETKTTWNKITAEEYRKAALEALENVQRKAPASGQQGGLFDDDAAATAAVQGDLFSAPAPVQAAAPAVDKSKERLKFNYKPPALAGVVGAELAAKVDAFVRAWKDKLPKSQISAEDRVRAEAMLEPVMAAAIKDEPVFDAGVRKIAEAIGGGYMLGPTKKMERTAVKLVEVDFDLDQMKDIVRATLVVKSYDQAQAVIDAISAEFRLRSINNKAPDAARIKPVDGVPIKDKRLPEGYRDVTVFVYLPSGGTAEIQINVPEMLSAKDAGHVLYEGSRVVEQDPERQAEYAALRDAQAELYSAAFLANRRKSDSEYSPINDPTGSALRGISKSVSSLNWNTPPPGTSTQVDAERSSKNLVPAGNLSGTFIASTSPIVPEGEAQQYTTGKGKSSNVATDADDRQGNAGPSAGHAPGTESGGQAAVVPAGDGRGDQQPGGDGVGADQGSGATAVPGEGRGDERTRGSRARNRAQRRAAVPAARDIKPKSGLNYRYTDDDISPPGSWAKRAEWNVDAVELIRKLEAEKRQATPDEQKILAKFVGWGASEIANNLFGGKLDKARTALEAYERAVAAFEKNGNRPMRRDPYGYSRNNYVEGQWDAFQVLQYADPKIEYQQATREITREQIDKAAPPKSVRKWLELRDRLKKALTADEWAEASRSTQYGHFTAAPIVRGMWHAVERFGFKGGLIFEPGSGKGNFPGLMPDNLAANSSYTGVEYDSLTGAILKQLLPDELVRVESFIDTQLPGDFFDLSVGNPPFSQTAVLGDPEYKKHAFKLHDYFFAKAMDRVRPGGLLMFVTSRYTMDKGNDKARKYLSERADLVGAIRLPQTAFKENAGTEVVTDVLFLRKKVPGETFEQGQAWGGVAPVNGADGQPLMIRAGKDKPDQPAMINEYFLAHPEMVLGQHSNAGSMYSDKEYTVTAPDGDIGELFRAAVERMPADIFKSALGSAGQAAQAREIDFNPTAKKEGNYYVTEAGVLMQREGGVGQSVVGMSKGDEAIVRSFVPLRDALKQAQYDQLNGGEWESSLKTLQAEYRKFVAAHGRINQFTLREQRVKVEVLDEEGTPTGVKEWTLEERPVYPLAAVLRDDPEYTLVRALEDVNEDTGEISDAKVLGERVLGGERQSDVATPHDAMLAVLNDTGKIDMGEIADRLGLDESAVIDALGTAVYRNPKGGAWETADEYLSGNVRKKLQQAESAAQADGSYSRNIEALKAAMPAPKGPSNINIAIGMNWIPGSFYEQFLKQVAGVDADVAWNADTRQWAVQFTGKDTSRSKASHKRDQATVEWGTAFRHTGELLEHALTGRPIMIKHSVSDGAGGKKEVTDTAAIEAANQKLEALKAEFAKWVWKDSERTDFLVRTFNERFNSIAPRKFDGKHLTLPGTSALFNVFDHVKRGAWRIIQSGNTYLAHAVGSGKTFEMVISAMEQKRLGLIKKPMMVVPNHMLRQFSAEWLQLYPAARLMVADEHAFHKDKRRQFVSRVALSDLDGVIITHDAFKLLDLDPEFRAKIIDEQVEFLRAALENAEEDDGNGGKKSPRVKQIEKRIEALEEKLKAAQNAGAKDQNARFDELGVDMLYVDEAHLYRKLDFGTSRQVKGISSEGSDRALDLYTKTRYLDEKRPGRSLVMASGTPITNTLAELYSVMRFLGRNELVEDGMEDFDSWAAQYGRETTSLEPTAAGKYEPVTRFAKFVNVPGVIQRFKQFADVLTADNLAALLGDQRPKVEGGQREIVVTPKTTRFRLYQRELAARYEASRKWKPSKEEPNNPDPVIKIIGDGRLAAIDTRFVNPSAPNDPTSKLNRMIDDVIQAYKESAGLEYTNKKTKEVEPNKGAAMMVFSDLGFGEGVAATRGFNARAWMEKRLRDAGIPPGHLAFMSDFKKASDKQKLFGDINAGRKRILVGSSKNMGTGVNAQQRLLYLFHLDTPWFPADLEQREGRIIRQGNKNKSVRIKAYATKGSYDETMWGMLARKSMFIAQAMEGDPNIDEIEDLDSQSQYEVAAAMVADDPRVLQLAGIKSEIGKMERLYQAHEADRMRFSRRFNDAQAEITANTRMMAAAEAAAAKVQDLSGDKFVATVNGKPFTERKAWGEALKDAARYLASGVERSQNIGEVSGFDVTFRSSRTESAFEWWVTLDVPVQERLIGSGLEDAVQLALRAQNAVTKVARLPAVLRDNIQRQRDEADSLFPRLQTPFPMAEMLAGKRREAAALEAEIAQASKDRDWVATRLDTGESFRVQAHNEETAVDVAMARNGGEPEFWRVAEFAEAREYDFDEAMGAAAMGMIPPVFLSRGSGGGMKLAALRGVKDRLAARLAGLPPVKVLASPADAPDALRAFIEKRGAMADVEGAYFGGQIYLFASGIVDEARAEHVLAEHEAAHAGLAGLLGSGRARAMQAIYNQNASIRRLVKPMMARGVSLAEAVEEAIVDMPSGRLARLQGWRAVVGYVRDALRRGGFERLAEQIDGWLAGHLTDQQRADLVVADLVRAARAFVGRRRAGSASLQPATAAALSDGKLADDLAEQEKWLNAEARARGFKDIDDLAENAYPVFEKLAEKWREKHPADALLSRAGKAGHLFHTTRLGNLDGISRDGLQAWKPARHAGVSSAKRISLSTSEDGASYYGGAGDVLLRTRAGYEPDDLDVDPLGGDSSLTAGKPIAPLDLEARVGGRWMPLDEAVRLVQAGVRVDDVSKAGLFKVGDKVVVRDGRRGTVKAIDAKLGAVEVNLHGGSLKFLADHVRPTDAPMLSTATATASAPDVATRAEALIQMSASTPKPLDAAFKLASKVTGLDRVASVAYGLGGKLIDRLVPESVKAGVVSDYGIPQAVLDRRGEFQGTVHGQMLQAGALVDKLATLTRAESRVAYEWMSGEDTRTADELMQALPEASVKVLRDVRDLIDRLSEEAVNLKQLDAETRDRHRFAYLRRSYFKHAADLTTADKETRGRAISIIGDQYKGRGMVRTAPMKQIQNIAPEWWGRKLKSGKADTALKGEKFIRFEKRAPVGAGVDLIPELERVKHESRIGRLQEVNFWPAGEPLPAKYADWENAGTWEVVDTKGADLVVWRDFTKDERVRMGEIDEARYAIAKTLRGMIHDIEVGKYLQWLAKTQAKKPGEEIDGQIIDAKELGFGRGMKSLPPGTWVKVPDTKIASTGVARYGDLAGRFLPGPVWNDVRQLNNRVMPLGESYQAILSAWKSAKTALSPAVHMNNVMSNFVMADWHDVTAGHVAKSLQIILAAHNGQGQGALGMVGNMAGKFIGKADIEAAREVIARYETSGGSIGGWVSQEIASDTLDQVRELLRAEVNAASAATGQGQVGVYAALQAMLHGKLPSAFEALRGSKPVQKGAVEAKNLINLYQAEDDVFRLAAWLKAKEGGADDATAGRTARRSFLDYSINAPWIAMMRATGWPFISYTYRAVPMLLEVMGKRPHKMLKLMAIAGALNAIGVMMSGDGDDDEERRRKMLPEEKAGKVWGIVPKLIRMPWNDAHGSPVYLDIRRWIPVGDVLDLGQGNAVVPVPPALMPGGPMAVLAELFLNKSMFTGKEISQPDIDSATERGMKMADHLWKAAAPNIIGVPGTYATTGVFESFKGRTDAFGRELSPAQAVSSAFGVKLGSYPDDVLQRNIGAKAANLESQLRDQVGQVKRQLMTNRITREEADKEFEKLNAKLRKVAEETGEKVR